MSKSVFEKMKKKGYKTAFKYSDTELAVTKDEFEKINDDSLFDIYKLNKSENLNGLVTFNDKDQFQLYRVR